MISLRTIGLSSLALALLLGGALWGYFRDAAPAEEAAAAATRFLAALDAGQKQKALLPYDSPQRTDWHFIPKMARKGLQIKEMNAEQQKAAHALLASVLSQIGYRKSTEIMSLEAFLHELEKARPNNIRDTQRYYFTLFGTPGAKGRWGLSVEGHHLSLNFVLEGDQIVSSTPTFFGANPAELKAEVPGVNLKKGMRVLAKEEQAAFDLWAALSPEQRTTARIADECPADIRGPAGAQPPAAAPQGIAAGKLSADQQRLLRGVIEAYTENVPADVAKARWAAIEKAGLEQVYFAWAGAEKPGVGHYYRVQGPSFLIEFVNIQPDAAGNPANHIHCVWRDMAGDFALPIK